MSEKFRNTQIDWDIDRLDRYLGGGSSARAIELYRSIQSYKLKPLSPLSLKLQEVELKHLQATHDMGAMGLHAKMLSHIKSIKDAQMELPPVN